MYFDEVILDDLDEELDIERNTMKFITDKEYKDIVSWTLENKSEDSEDYKKLVRHKNNMKREYWIVFNNKDYKADPNLVMDMLTDEYLADREEKEIQ